jgi:SAM-dependent methyltransferase
MTLLRPFWRRVRETVDGHGHAAPRDGGLGYNRLCNLEDFAHPALLPVLREVFAQQVRDVAADFPLGRESRKDWEVAMAVRTLRDAGCLHRGAEVLGVGAGHEPTVFWLTNHVGRVFATDLYLQPGVWTEFANASMLTEPGRHWPGEWEPRRLVAQHMDGTDLKYPDGAFDAIFSSSSVEHFGGPDAVRRSVEEMFRVLKPGGVLSLATECRLEGPGPGIPETLLFDAAELQALFLDGLDWRPLSPPTFEVSAATRASEMPVEEYVEDLRANFAAHGEMVAFHDLHFRRYPQILLRAGEHLFTSYHLALRKPG